MIEVSKFNFRTFWVALLLFLTLQPYFVWSLSSYLNPIISVIIGIIFFNEKELVSNGVDYKDLAVYFFFVIVLFAITGGANILGAITMFAILFIPFGNTKFSGEVIYYLSVIYSVIVGLALISWFLMQFNLIFPIKTISPLNENDFEYYTVYPLFQILANNNGLFGATRFAGPFDEPGVIGSISAVLLCLEKFNFKNWKTYIYLISGIVSFSFFFYLVVVSYGLFYLILIKKRVWPTIIFFALFAGVYMRTKDDPIISYTIWNRFEWDSTSGTFSGDNRMTEDAEDFYKSKRGTYEYWFGLKDYDSYWKLAKGGCSYKNTVMKNGMVAFALYALFFLIIAWRNKQSKVSFLLFAFLFLSMLYQRPILFQSAWILIFTYFSRSQLIENKLLKNVQHSSNDLDL